MKERGSRKREEGSREGNTGVEGLRRWEGSGEEENEEEEQSEEEEERE